MFSTINLDLAAYLLTKGYECSVTRLEADRAEFSFARSWWLAFHVKRFHGGMVRIDLSHFMYMRTHLKMRTKLRTIEALPVNPYPVTTMKLGQSYWYTEGDQVYHAVYGHHKPHTTRIQEGRAFGNRSQAIAALSEKK